MLIVLLVASPGFVGELRQSLFDGYQRVFPRERKSAPAIVVEIDESSLLRFGQWPWPRTLMAKLVEKISGLGARAIGFDILFPEPDRYSPAALGRTLTQLPEDLVQRLETLPGNDERFAEAVRGRGVVLAVAGDDEIDPPGKRLPPSQPLREFGDATLHLKEFAGHIGNVPVLEKAAASRGLISIDASDTSVRRVRLLADVGGVEVRSLALEALRVATGVTALRLYPRPDGLRDIGLGDVRIPVQSDGSFWMYFSRRACNRCISAADVLTDRIAPAMLAGKIALVGVTGLGLLDYKVTPFGEKVPGVTGHAQIIEQIFDGSYLIRPPWTLPLELVLLGGGAWLLMIVVPRRRVGVSLAALLGLIALFAAAGLSAFRYGGVLLDVAWPGIGVVGIFAFLLTSALAEAERQRRALRDAAARLAGELEAARRIQMGLLPSPEEAFRGERGFELHALLEPARTVGGDFYECFKLDRHRLFFAVGDVSGKGMPAALFMALTKSIMRAAVVRGSEELGIMVSRAAAEIVPQNPEYLFVTLFAAILDLRDGGLEYCNAGHPPPYGRRVDGTIERYPAAGGPPLCVLTDFEYPTGYRTLQPGEWLCVVTDGVTEATDNESALYGTERLLSAIARAASGLTARDLSVSLREDVRQFSAGASLSDDLTLLVVRWNGAAAAQPGGAPRQPAP